MSDIDLKPPSSVSESLRANWQAGQDIAYTLVGGGIAIYAGASMPVFLAVAGGLAARSYFNMVSWGKRIDAAHEREARQSHLNAITGQDGPQ